MATPQSMQELAVKKYSRTIYKLLDATVDVTWFGFQLEHELFVTATERKSILQSAVLTRHGKHVQLMNTVLRQIKLDVSGSKLKSFVTILKQQKSMLSAVYLLQQESSLDLPDSSISPPTSRPVQPFDLVLDSDHRGQLSFSQLLASLIESLEKKDGALVRVKSTLKFFILPDPNCAKRVTHVFPPQQYRLAETVEELFRKLASHCSFFSDCRFLRLLSESSGCQATLDELAVFLSERDSAVSCGEMSASIKQEPACISSLDLHSPASSFAVTTQPRAGLIKIEAKLDARGLTQQAYSNITTAVRRCLQLPGPTVQYCGMRHIPLIITWEMPARLVSYVLSIQVTKRDIQALSGVGIKELTVGSFFQLALPTLKYWERRTPAVEDLNANVTGSSELPQTCGTNRPYPQTADNGTEGAITSSSQHHEDSSHLFHISKTINIHPSDYDNKRNTSNTMAESQQEQDRRLPIGTSEHQTTPGVPEVTDCGDLKLHADDSLNIPSGPQWEMFFGQWTVGGIREVFLLASIGTRSDGNPDVVPLHEEVELADDDLRKLENQGVPGHCRDDISIVRARITLDSTLISSGEEVSTTGQELTRGYVLQQLEEFLNRVETQGAVIHYIGHGRKRTGDWCFKDGFITFRDIMHLHNTTRIKGRVLGIVSNCSHSGSWVQECCRYLDEQGVSACGHSTTEKGILLKVYASCKPSETANTLAYSVHGMQNDKNNGTMSFFLNKELQKSQHTDGISFSDLRCGQSPQDPCSLRSPKYTWMKRYQGRLLHIVRGKDKGRPAWHYVLLVDDEETIRVFNEKVRSGTLDVANYGQILHSGWGEDPPNELRDEIEKQYHTMYK